MTDQSDDEMIAMVPGDEIEQVIRTKNAIAMECLQHLYRSIPFGAEFELSNGMVGSIKQFVEPRERDDGSLESGIDVKLLQGGKEVGHIEFFLKKTGWGMALTDTPPIEA